MIVVFNDEVINLNACTHFLCEAGAELAFYFGKIEVSRQEFVDDECRDSAFDAIIEGYSNDIKVLTWMN